MKKWIALARRRGAGLRRLDRGRPVPDDQRASARRSRRKTPPHWPTTSTSPPLRQQPARAGRGLRWRATPASTCRTTRWARSRWGWPTAPPAAWSTRWPRRPGIGAVLQGRGLLHRISGGGIDAVTTVTRTRRHRIRCAMRQLPLRVAFAFHRHGAQRRRRPGRVRALSPGHELETRRHPFAAAGAERPPG